MKLRAVFVVFFALIAGTGVFGQQATKKKEATKKEETSSRQTTSSTIVFSKDVFPILRSNCLPCHLAENENPSGLALDNYETLMKGGEHGNTVVPGKPKESNLYLKLLPKPPFGKQMARNRKKLSEEEIMTIYKWIEQGAKEK